METIPRIAYRTAIILPLVLLISLVLSACSGSQQIDSVAEIDSTTIESLTTAALPAETPTATPTPTATSTATVTPSPIPNPTPFPEPNDAEYNMLTCKAVGGVPGFVNFDDSEKGTLDGLEDVIEPAFYTFYEGSDDLLHHVWSHFYQQAGDAPTDAEGVFLPYGAFSDTNYDICLRKEASDAGMVGIHLIVPQVQSQEAIDAACKSPNANGFAGQTQATAIYVPEDGTLASEMLANVELSDCYGFISGVQTPEENAIAHLINQYAKPVYDVNPADAIPEEAVLNAQSYMVFTKDKDIYSNFPFHFMLSPGGDAFLVECPDNNYGEGRATDHPEICSMNISFDYAPFVEPDRPSETPVNYDNPPNLDFACISDYAGLNCSYPIPAINVFPGEIRNIRAGEQVRVQYRTSEGTFTMSYGHIVPVEGLGVGDLVEVGDILGYTYDDPYNPVNSSRHYLSISLINDTERVFLDPMDPRFGLYKVANLPLGKTWKP